MFGAPLRAPRGALPLPLRRSARPQGGAALPPPLGAGVRFIPSPCSLAALGSSSHSPPRFALLPSVCPRRVGREVCFRAALRAALRMRFSFPRGVRRCGAPPSSGRRNAPPPSCAFFLPSARVSLPPFLLRVLSPFRECSCGVFPLRRVKRFARCLARRVPRRSRAAAFPAALRAQGGVYAPAPCPQAGRGMRERR